jgi:hypothetical protein
LLAVRKHPARPGVRRWPHVVLATGALLLAVAVAVALSDSKPRLAGTNRVPAADFTVELRPGQRICQGEETVPKDAAAVRFTTPASGRADLGVEISAGRSVARGARRGAFAAGQLRVPVTRVERSAQPGTVCVTQRGGAPVKIAGLLTGPNPASAVVDGGQTAGRVRIEYLRGGEESWWSLAPTIVHRFGIGKGGLIGSWAVVPVALLLLAAWGAAALALLREPRT